MTEDELDQDEGESYPTSPTKVLFVVLVIAIAAFLISVPLVTSNFVAKDILPLADKTRYESNAATALEEQMSGDPTLVSSVSNLTLEVIDVGQADAILLTHNDTSIIIDAGQSMRASDASKAKLFSSLGNADVKTLLVTHQDYDHIGNAKRILEDYNVTKFIDNGHIHTSNTYEELLSNVNYTNLDYDIVSIGDSVSIWDDVNITVLSPSKLTSDVNDDSIVLKVTFGDFDALLMGDAGVSVESEVAKLSGEVEMLKVGHHGSDTATSESFVSLTSPEISIISVGKGNSYGHPSDIVLKRLESIGSTIYRTDSDGNVIVDTNGVDYYVTTSN